MLRVQTTSEQQHAVVDWTHQDCLCMLLLLEGIIINWYLSIVDMTYENIILLIEWLQYGTAFLTKWWWLTIYIIKGVMFVCFYVPYGRPNGWADRDQTWHMHSCPSRECFCQGQCQGHLCMRAGVTELRNTRKTTPGERCSNYVRRTGEATPGERLRNSVRTMGNYSSSNEARRHRHRAASAEGASRTPSGGRVITASINIFKNRLDKFWASHDFVYLFRAQPLETGRAT